MDTVHDDNDVLPINSPWACRSKLTQKHKTHNTRAREQSCCGSSLIQRLTHLAQSTYRQQYGITVIPGSLFRRRYACVYIIVSVKSQIIRQCIFMCFWRKPRGRRWDFSIGYFPNFLVLVSTILPTPALIKWQMVMHFKGICVIPKDS